MAAPLAANNIRADPAFDALALSLALRRLVSSRRVTKWNEKGRIRSKPYARDIRSLIVAEIPRKHSLSKMHP